MNHYRPSLKPHPLTPVVVKIRNCLKCRKEFTSTGDRICPPCTEENSKVSARGQRDKGGSFRRGYGVGHNEAT